MKTNWKMSQSEFDKLLLWLDEDREIAANKYEAIRLRLIKILNYRGCHEAEELADEVIDRVIKKIDNLLKTYEGNPENYFFGVANNVYREFLRKVQPQDLPAVLVQKETIEEDFQPEYKCLKTCLQRLPKEKREFIIEYYKSNKTKRIKERKRLAEKIGIDIGGMHVRAFRLRKKLQKCVLKCVKKNKY